ncbi:MAG: hypothetical protein KC643_32100 [Nitrospira sp.]|nr:hypothetical protein [Nitrospira sp.]
MKIPQPISPVFRRNLRGRFCSLSAVLPSDFCEDVCHENYDIGSDEHQACLEDCRD